jgi:transposase-like protein
MNELKLEVLLEPERTGDSVADVCRRRGISRASYCRYRRRSLDEGAPTSRAHAGPALRRVGSRPSSRPRSSRCASDTGAGARGGSTPKLARAGTEPPAVATIHRALKRNYLVARSPHGRARRPGGCFERERPNDLWQIDGTQLKLAEASRSGSSTSLDDHARFLLAALACASPPGEAARACFVAASSAYGLPRRLLSDNHTNFTGRLFRVVTSGHKRAASIDLK